MIDKKFYLVNTNGMFTNQEQQMTKQGVKYYTWHLYKKNPNDKEKPFMDLTIASWNIMIVGDHLLLVKVDINEHTTITREQFANNPDNVKEVSFEW